MDSLIKKEKCKVLQVNKLYFPHIGGVEKVVQDISEGLPKEFFDVEVLVCQQKGSLEVEFINNVKITRANSLGVYLSMPISIEFPNRLYNLGKDVDIIHFHFPFPLGDMSYLFNQWRMGKKRPKIVVTWHSDIVRQKKAMIFYKPFLNRFLQLADVIIVTSPNMIENSRYLRKFRDKCIIVPLGIDLKTLKTTVNQKVPRIKLKYEKTVLFVGRLCYYKGINFLIEAMENVQANLVIIGEGELRNELETICKGKQLVDKVHFIGRCDQTELNSWYELCDLFVLPSIEPSEAFGLVQAEAMSVGKPVINTNLPTGVPFVSVHGETGLTVQPRNVIELENAINRVLLNPLEASLYGENAVKRVQELFTKSAMLSKITKIYRDLINN
jgi:glycosyltransferase involved in cell wall biosynthesis